MTQNNQITEPDFEGEEMKMPASSDYSAAAPDSASGRMISGPIIILLVLVLLTILGGLYYWYYTVMNTPLIEPEKTIRPTAEENNEPESTTAEARTDAMETVSTSDELDAIEADIESTNFTELDAEMNAIEAELESGMEVQ